MGDTADDLANISIIGQLQEQNDNLKKLIEQQAKLIRMQKVANLKNRDSKTLTEIDRIFIENEESANNELTEEDRAELVTAFKNRELMEKLGKEKTLRKNQLLKRITIF